jgi:hypothetical protein
MLQRITSTICRLLLIGSGILGVWCGLSEAILASDRASILEARDIGKFLDSARSRIVPDSQVVVVTSLLPVADFDYWFGATRPVRLLFVVERKGFVQASGVESAPSTAELETFIGSLGLLLTRQSFDAAIRGADYLVVTDEPALNRLSELLGTVPGRDVLQIGARWMRDLKVR